eukprot:gene9240-1659_t
MTMNSILMTLITTPAAGRSLNSVVRDEFVKSANALARVPHVLEARSASKAHQQQFDLASLLGQDPDALCRSIVGGGGTTSKLSTLSAAAKATTSQDCASAASQCASLPPYADCDGFNALFDCYMRNGCAPNSPGSPIPALCTAGGPQGLNCGFRPACPSGPAPVPSPQPGNPQGPAPVPSPQPGNPQEAPSLETPMGQESTMCLCKAGVAPPHESTCAFVCQQLCICHSPAIQPLPQPCLKRCSGFHASKPGPNSWKPSAVRLPCARTSMISLRGHARYAPPIGQSKSRAQQFPGGPGTGGPVTTDQQDEPNPLANMSLQEFHMNIAKPVCDGGCGTILTNAYDTCHDKISAENPSLANLTGKSVNNFYQLACTPDGHKPGYYCVDTFFELTKVSELDMSNPKVVDDFITRSCGQCTNQLKDLIVSYVQETGQRFINLCDDVGSEGYDPECEPTDLLATLVLLETVCFMETCNGDQCFKYLVKAAQGSGISLDDLNQGDVDLLKMLEDPSKVSLLGDMCTDNCLGRQMMAASLAMPPQNKSAISTAALSVCSVDPANTTTPCLARVITAAANLDIGDNECSLENISRTGQCTPICAGRYQTLKTATGCCLKEFYDVYAGIDESSGQMVTAMKTCGVAMPGNCINTTATGSASFDTTTLNEGLLQANPKFYQDMVQLDLISNLQCGDVQVTGVTLNCEGTNGCTVQTTLTGNDQASVDKASDKITADGAKDLAAGISNTIFFNTSPVDDEDTSPTKYIIIGVVCGLILLGILGAVAAFFLLGMKGKPSPRVALEDPLYRDAGAAGAYQNIDAPGATGSPQVGPSPQ